MNADIGAIEPDMFELWDRLAAFPASRTDQALQLLLDELVRRVDGCGAYWLGVMRLQDAPRNDPMQGWRPVRIRYQRQDPGTLELYRSLMSRLRKGVIDASMIEQTARAGAFRVHTLAEIVPADYFGSEHHDIVYRSRGINSVLFVVTPIHADAESYIGLHRNDGREFSARERSEVATLLRGITWFQRQVFLSQGLAVGRKPLRDSERRVMAELLTSRSEADIARKLGLSPTTVHTYIRKIYRRLGVGSRAALTALWLGERSADEG